MILRRLYIVLRIFGLVSLSSERSLIAILCTFIPVLFVEEYDYLTLIFSVITTRRYA